MKSSKLILGVLTGTILGTAVSAAALAGDDGKDRKDFEQAAYSRSIKHQDKSDMDKRHETDAKTKPEAEECDHDSEDGAEKEPEQHDAE